MRNIGPVCGHDTQYPGLVKDGNGHAMGTDAGVEVHAAVAKDAEVHIEREQSGAGLQSSASCRFVRCLDAI